MEDGIYISIKTRGIFLQTHPLHRSSARFAALCPDSKYTHSNPFNSSSIIGIMMIRRRNDSLHHHNLSDKMKYRSFPRQRPVSAA
ncbi:hypothetical protein CEXT_534771 [Caerostris extrusa]|uniref:Ycf15 n=1 Tax=Caerostris extrusa TaxID=172846 RepID=A0AAV4SGN9_CAEEX|nr:hypothetical protein CEXT_534771 [Caerostris extrusa]